MGVVLILALGRQQRSTRAGSKRFIAIMNKLVLAFAVAACASALPQNYNSGGNLDNFISSDEGSFSSGGGSFVSGGGSNLVSGGGSSGAFVSGGSSGGFVSGGGGGDGQDISAQVARTIPAK